MKRVRYFDDDALDAEEIARDLRNDELDVSVAVPTQSLEIPNDDDLDGYLVDYVLETKVTFQGGTLAAALTERRELPIVLLTRENQVEGRSELELVDELPQFDAVVFKGRILANQDGVRQQILRLIDGYDVLRALPKDLAALVAAMAPPSPRDRELVLEVAPPITRNAWRIAGVARWLSHVVVRYPGVLLDGLAAASIIGVTEASFRAAQMAELFRPAMYSGPMKPVGDRWWKANLLEIAAGITLVGESGPIHVVFPNAFERQIGPVVRAMCVDGCGEPADAVCFVLQKPVRTAHSVVYFPDQRPRIMDAARISFKALREDNRARPELVDPSAKAIIRRLLHEGVDA